MPDPQGNSPQFPLKVVGPIGQNAFIGLHQVRFTGNTGLVSTSYGVPDMVVTRMSTGVYGIYHNKIQNLTIVPGMQAPSGYAYDLTIVKPPGAGAGLSGYQELHISRMQPSPSGIGGNPSSYKQPFNPVTGSSVNLMCFFSPTEGFDLPKRSSDY